jgi:hypothetical protein
MKGLISIEELIEQLRNEKIDFGKGNPYNRLRYFTKIGWLPHMIRKQDKNGNVVGHYPSWVVERIKKIEDLKKHGKSNDDISFQIKKNNVTENLSAILYSRESRMQLFQYFVVISLVFIIMSELNIVKIGKSKTEIYPQTQPSSFTSQIVKTEQLFVPKGRDSLFVPIEAVEDTSQIYVTFNSNYAPALRYWVSSVEPGSGFELSLDAPVSEDAVFTWWLLR